MFLFIGSAILPPGIFCIKESTVLYAQRFASQ